MSKKFFIPLFMFLALGGLMYFGLSNDPKIIPSPFIGQAAPEFELPRLYKPDQTISVDEMKGKVWVLNLWASWCASCQAEHRVLSRFIKQHNVPTVGLNYKDYGTEDYGDAAIKWLQQLGNPYYAVAVDTKGMAGIDWGVVGVPETFVIDKKGIVRHKFTGPVSQKDIDTDMVPLIKQLREESEANEQREAKR